MNGIHVPGVDRTFLFSFYTFKFSICSAKNIRILLKTTNTLDSEALIVLKLEAILRLEQTSYLLAIVSTTKSSLDERRELIDSDSSITGSDSPKVVNNEPRTE